MNGCQKAHLLLTRTPISRCYVRQSIMVINWLCLHSLYSLYSFQDDLLQSVPTQFVNTFLVVHWGPKCAILLMISFYLKWQLFNVSPRYKMRAAHLVIFINMPFFVKNTSQIKKISQKRPFQINNQQKGSKILVPSVLTKFGGTCCS